MQYIPCTKMQNYQISTIYFVHSFRKYLKNINYLDSCTINVCFCHFLVVIHEESHSNKTGRSTFKFQCCYSSDSGAQK